MNAKNVTHLSIVRFDCPRCGQTVETRERVASVGLRCPTCNEFITVAQLLPPSVEMPYQPRRRAVVPWPVVVFAAFVAVVCLGKLLEFENRAPTVPPGEVRIEGAAGFKPVEELPNNITASLDTNGVTPIRLAK